MHKPNWSEWLPFPDPRKQTWISAPYGLGVYELRQGDELIKVGKGKNTAYRMSSLVPKKWGSGTRNNWELRDFIWSNVDAIEYRCCACPTEEDARSLEKWLLDHKTYRFAK